jgi:uncharacterized membrane protein YcaP (DUF421 family)
MRLLGKRQLGELEVSELVTALLISEIASLPIVDQNIPIMYAIIPLITILALEVALSVILLKCPKLKNLASSRPSVLIRHGCIDRREMQRNRISMEELISEARQKGIASLAEVDYAIVEQNGKISILPRKAQQPPSAEMLGIKPRESGILHILIADGTPNRYNLEQLGVDEKKLEKILARGGVCREEVLLLGMDDLKKTYLLKKEAP